MTKQELIIRVRFEISAVKQALRSSEEMQMTEQQIGRLLDRLKKVQDLLEALES